MVDRSRLRWFVWLSLVALVLASCSEGSDNAASVDSPPPTSSDVVEVEDDEEEPSFVNGKWVQDFWVYEQILTVDEAGETVDLSDAVVENLGTPDETLELPNDGLFHTFESLNPSVTDAEGETRDDIDTIAGILEFEDMSGLVVLATPHPDAPRPIGMTDHVELDLDHIEDLLGPESPLVIDFAFMQTLPTFDEPSATGIELFARRLSEGQARYLSQQIDGIDEPSEYSNALGSTLPSTMRMQVSGKGSISDPGLDGMRDGFGKCLRGFGPRCVRKYFGSTEKGAAKSNDLIKCNLGGDCGDEPPGDDTPGSDTPGNGNTGGNNSGGGNAGGNNSGGNNSGGGNAGGNNSGGTNSGGNNSGGSGSDIPWCGSMCSVPTGPPAEVRGDPHLRSFDGASSYMQGVGEYVLSEGSLLSAHIRTEPINETTRSVSSVSMVGLEVGDNTIVVDAPERQVRVRVNGEEIAYNPAQNLVTTIDLDGDITLFVEPNSVTVSDPSNEMGVVIRNDWSKFLDLSLHVPDSYTELTGLLGDHDGNGDNDLRARNGDLLAEDATDEQYYSDFADTWRVTQDESLLHYEDDETTTTWTNSEFPYPDEPAPTAEEISRGEALCRLAGVSEETLIRQCAFDFAASGNIGFVRSAQTAQTRDERITIIADVAADGMSQQGNEGNTSDLPDSGSTDEDSWQFSVQGWDEGTEFVHTCVPDGSFHVVWGGNDGIYTSDSSICTAAVHADLITKEAGGRVVVTVTAGLDDYGLGSEQNGVTTRQWQKAWSGSFTLRNAR